MISRQTVTEFLNQERDDYTWIKQIHKHELMQEIKSICPEFNPKVDLFQHQLASILLGITIPNFLYFLDMGLGKEQPLHSQILTPSGWIKMKDVKVGTLICHPSQPFSRVTHIFPQGTKPVYTVKFADGTSADCGLDHLWMVTLTSKKNKASSITLLKPLKELIFLMSDYVCEVPLPKSAHIELMSLTDIFTEEDYEYLVEPEFKHAQYQSQDYLCDFHKYQILSILMNTSLPTYKQGTFTHPQFTYVKSLQFLLNSLGAKTTLTEFENKYSLSYQLFERELLNKEILDIEYLGQFPCQCIKVDNPDGLYLTDGVTVTHNTMIALSILMCRFQLKEVKKALIVVPNEVNIENWLLEIKKYTQFTAIALLGTKEKRKTQLQKPAQLYLINYDGLKVLMTDLLPVTRKKSTAKQSKARKINPLVARQFAQGFQLVVFDECHRVKHSTSLNYKLANIIASQVEFRFGMTGTPIGRNPLDFWAQFHIIDRGVTLGAHEQLFKEAMFKQRFNRGGFSEWYLPKKQLPVLNKMISNRSLNYADTECNDLPELTVTQVYLPFAKDASLYYRQLLTDAITMMENDPNKKINIYAKARQLCSGFIYEGDPAKRSVIRFPECEKLTALEELIEDIPASSKILIAYVFHESGVQIQALLHKLKIPSVDISGTQKDNNKAYHDFLTNKKIKVLTVNILAGGEGLNLQVANYIIIYEPINQPDKHRQMVKRIHRTGQRQRCFVYQFITKKSIEEKIKEYLDEGRDLMEALMNNTVNLTDLKDMLNDTSR